MPPPCASPVEQLVQFRGSDPIARRWHIWTVQLHAGPSPSQMVTAEHVDRPKTWKESAVAQAVNALYVEVAV